MTKTITDFQGYKVIPLKLRPKSSNCHQIYMREHFIRVIDSNKPKGRTLFLLNIPPYIKKEHLEKCFNKVGEVLSIILAEKPGKDDEGVSKFESANDIFSTQKRPFIFKVAYIIFKSTKSVKNALELTALEMFDDKKSFVKTGIEKWMEEYLNSIIDEDELQSEIDNFMSTFDANEKAALDAEKSGETGNDGWITVGKRGKNSGFEQKESVINKLEEKIEKSKKKKELKNFYTFQIRESKMQNIVSLRKRFEEDKKKIETLKKSRRFKPF